MIPVTPNPSDEPTSVIDPERIRKLLHDANNRLASALLELQLLQGKLDGPHRERAKDTVRLLVDAIDQFDQARRELNPESQSQEVGAPPPPPTPAPPMPTTPTISALVVDDEEPILHILREILVSCGAHQVDTATTPDDALNLFSEHHHDLVFTDAMLGVHGNGTDLARQIRSVFPDVVIVLMSGWDQEDAEEGLFDHCLAKPFQLREVSDIVASLTTAP